MPESLDWLKDSIVTLAIIVFLATIMAITISDFQDDTGTAGSVNEENSTATGVILGVNLGAFPYELVGVSKIENASGLTLPTGWYNVTVGEGGYVTLTPNQTGKTMNVTYTYIAADGAYNVTYYGLQGEKNVSSYFDTIGTILGVAVLLMLVMAAFYFAKR